MHAVFREARLRAVVPAALAATILPYVVAGFATDIDFDTEALTAGMAILQVVATLFATLLLWLIWCRRFPVSDVAGSPLSRQDARRLALLGIPLVGASLFCFYLLFYPLSLVAPDFVIGWALDVPELIVPADRPQALAINCATALLLVIAAPLFEELLFRGFMLGRLTHKLGPAKAIVLSSIPFALLHPDVLGAFLFSVIASLACFRYRSLLAPILMHATNNGFVFLLTGVDILVLGTQYDYSLDEFYRYWWLAPVGGVVGIPWLYRFYQNELRQLAWRDVAAR